MALTSKQPFEVNDFSLGISDDAFESDPRFSTELDNFNIEPDGSLKSRQGYVIEVAGTPQIPAGVKRIGAIINYDHSSNLLVQSEDKFYYRNPTSYTTLVGPVTSNDVFSVGAETNNISFSEWNKQLFVTNDGYPRPMKIYKDSGGTIRVNTSGLPALATAPTCTPVAGANSYVYRFHYYFSYTVGSQTFEDVGPVTQVSVTSAAAPDISTIAITAIPVLANGATDNWDTAAIKVQIFRTTASGTSFYYVGQVTNGTTTYNDTSSDTTIQNNVLIYTEDGTVEADPVPLHKYVHIVNNIAYYAYIKDGSVEYPFKIRQSIPAAPSAAPLDFELDVEDQIAGIGSVNSVPIVLCKRHVYRLEGNFDQFGRGGINPVRISDTAGCISHLSIVSAEGQIFWAGNDGFYVSDGYRVQKISDKINSRYRALREAATDEKRIAGKFDEENRRILWAVQSDSSSGDNDSMVVLELRWGIRSHSTFTTWSGTSMRPTALEFFDNKLYTADTRGYVYYHEAGRYTDPRVETSVAAASWEQETIIWNYTSCNYNFGGAFFRKKPTRILLTARNIANTSIQITSLDDDGKRERELKPIRWRRNFIWGDVNFIWGDPDCVWRGLGIIEQWRRFPARGLRLSYCQIKISNAYCVISNSDTLGLATFDGTANTATLATGDWPSASTDYYISTSADAYVTQYQVTSQAADELTLVDSGNTLPTGSYAWLLKGYKKGEPLNLQGYTIHVADVDQQQMTYETGDDGANA
jgi:hypothetical protein